MEDKYLSKAKRIDNGDWLVGYIVKYGYTGKEKYYIVPSYASDLYAIEIDPSTICRSTGLKGKNNKLIWKNDIVKDLFSDACAQIKYGSYQSCFDSTKTEHVGFYVDWSGKYTKRYRKDLGYWIHMVNAEVIGNIFDNKELLESEEK
jgi:uncharacterized phage protein (TIGR01671 family)